MEPLSGIVFDIQRFALHDGPGIRTTVFLKGCPLSCVWCHNPESQALQPQLSYNAARCQTCTACADACHNGVHQVVDGLHVLDRSQCAGCGPCTDACPEEALTLIGEAMTVERVMEEVLRDLAYYRHSGGGLTLSGGEPLMQFTFAVALLRAARLHGLHTCLDTSGAVSPRKMAAAADYVDLFLYDYKATDSNIHRILTGAPNTLILDNLAALYQRGARIILRCPLVPGVNDSEEHLAGIAALSDRYPDLEGIEILPYHNMGRDKAAQIGYTNPLADLPSTDAPTQARWIETLHGLGCTRARLG